MCLLYIEYIGYVVLYARTHVGAFSLAPGERKEVIKENVVYERPGPPDGDVYPAGIIE